jgi:hypothetical protein
MPPGSLFISRRSDMPISAAKKPLFLLAVSLPMLLAGCATRESVDNAQAAADLADTHAKDAITRADAAHARADEAAGIGNNALAKSQSNEQRVQALESDLKTAHAQIKWLSRNVVYKHPPHRKKHRVLHRARSTTPPGSATTHKSPGT